MDHPVPPPAAIMHLITNLWATQAAASFARFGVADQLAQGPRTADDLAAAVGAHPGALYRVLRALVGVGIVTREGDRFALTPAGQMLRSGVPGSMRSLLIAET